MLWMHIVSEWYVFTYWIHIWMLTFQCYGCSEYIICLNDMESLVEPTYMGFDCYFSHYYWFYVRLNIYCLNIPSDLNDKLSFINFFLSHIYKSEWYFICYAAMVYGVCDPSNYIHDFIIQQHEPSYCILLYIFFKKMSIIYFNGYFHKLYGIHVLSCWYVSKGWLICLWSILLFHIYYCQHMFSTYIDVI